ncbi:MAG: hypothetical protein JNL24_14395 [Bacteroidia bacterium]|nr:hypothetical protein [Bacteroidia bacterium]
MITLLPITALTQEQKSFKIDDLIALRESDIEKTHEFLKSRFFDFVKKEENCCYHYALNYNKYSKTADMWTFKYFDGRVKVLQGGEAELLLFIKGQLKSYKIDMKFKDEGWVETEFKYRNHDILFRENDGLSKYELYID